MMDDKTETKLAEGNLTLELEAIFIWFMCKFCIYRRTWIFTSGNDFTFVQTFESFYYYS